MFVICINLSTITSSPGRGRKLHCAVFSPDLDEYVCYRTSGLNTNPHRLTKKSRAEWGNPVPVAPPTPEIHARASRQKSGYCYTRRFNLWHANPEPPHSSPKHRTQPSEKKSAHSKTRAKAKAKAAASHASHHPLSPQPQFKLASPATPGILIFSTAHDRRSKRRRRRRRRRRTDSPSSSFFEISGW